MLSFVREGGHNGHMRVWLDMHSEIPCTTAGCRVCRGQGIFGYSKAAHELRIHIFRLSITGAYRIS